MYANGQGVGRDYKAAVRWFQKAAEQGNADAQIMLGNLYGNGRGVPLDYEAAVSWWRKAAEQGDASAQDALGSMYGNGQGVPLDYEAALSWYRKAAEQGNASAQYALGSMYGNGQGVPLDYKAAASWYWKAADQGNADAQYALGKMYADYGLAQDYVIAHMMFSLAAAGGSEEAAKQRDIIANGMTSAKIAEARKRAAEWRPKMANAAPTDWVDVELVVPMKMDGGIFVVPVQINGTITLDFVIDSGASDVSVPADVFSTLRRAGTIRESDFIGQRTFWLTAPPRNQPHSRLGR
jgi:TPR repeat protein